MSITVRGQVGPQTLADGVEQGVRLGKSAELIGTDLHGRYYEQAYRGNVFVAANSAVQALSLVSATATGLVLSNPAGSGKNLALIDISVSIAAAVTAVANVVLCANVNPIAAATVHTTPLVVRSTLLGSSGSAAGLADSSATLPAAPVIIRSLMGWHWVTAGTTTTALFLRDEIAGGIIITPGCAVSVQGLTVAHTVIASMTWEEIPV